MKVLVVGSGGREHAILWKLVSEEPGLKAFCAPGNAGTARIATNVPISAEDLNGLINWARENKPDLTVIGPEAPLCSGIADIFGKEGFPVFGPSRTAAQIEGSKVFSKEVMLAAGVPTAHAEAFNEPQKALDYIRANRVPLVVKADGLAAGKGVSVCNTREEAEAAVQAIMRQRIFGQAGNRILIEEYLEGEEASILALVDGRQVVMLASSQDHKRVYDGDRGPNTGGMGAYSPTPVVNENLWQIIREQVFRRTLEELDRRGIVYKGVLYAGLMITKDGPKVLEFNCRFGDPETQAILPRLRTDLLPALQACVDGCLKESMVGWRPDPCVCVVMASGGYPGKYESGKKIVGLDKAVTMEDVIIFHAGTALRGNEVVTAGGRVLGVTALGKDLQTAVERVYRAVAVISFESAHYRKDIAARALK